MYGETMIMPVYKPKNFNFNKDELPEELPINLKAFQAIEDDLKEVPKPVTPSKIMVLRMLVIMGTVGAILLFMGMAAILMETL